MSSNVLPYYANVLLRCMVCLYIFVLENANPLEKSCPIFVLTYEKLAIVEEGNSVLLLKNNVLF